MRATEIAHRLAGRSMEFCQWLYPNGRKSGRDWCVGSLSGEAGNSLKICIEGTRAGRWADFGGAQEDKGDLVGLLKRARGIDLKTACEQALDWLGVPPEQRTPGGPRVAATPRPIATRAPSDTWLRIQKRMKKGTPSQLMALADLRKLPAVAGLELATRAGHLWFCDVWDDGFEWPSWLITDGSRRNAQARRTDGQPWSGIGGKKAKTIVGCEAGWPVGITEAATKPVIALVEGAPDLLAAWHFIWLSEQTARTTPVAMFGVNAAIHPEALPLFAGKEVWIFAHEDDNKVGLLGAMAWRTQLKTAGVKSVEFSNFGPGIKDLNDFATARGMGDKEESA